MEWRGGESKGGEGKQREIGGERTQRSPETGCALKDTAELATLGLRKDFKRVATEAETTTMDTFHSRTVFGRSATLKRGTVFFHQPFLLQCGLLTWVCGKLGWLEHKASDHGFDPSVSL